MKDFKGTQGKWKVLDNKFVRGEYLRASHLIATVNEDMSYPANSKMGRSNANLIAAAPELLEALQVLLDVDQLDPVSVFKAERNALLVINKALGQ